MDNLPENRFEGGGADIDSDGLSAASPVAAPRRARLSVRPRAAADGSAPQDDTPARRGMPPRTEDSTPPPVRRPLMRPSSEFGYLFSDDEPVDNHMDDSYSRRLDGLAYEGKQDDEQYADLMDGTQPSMVRRPENRSSAGPASFRSPQEQPAERPSRFSRRSRSTAPQESAPMQPEVFAEPAAPAPEPVRETAPPMPEEPMRREEGYRPRRRYEADEGGYDPRDRRNRRAPEPGAAYPPPYGQYPAVYPPGYPVQPGYPPYGYPVQPGYPPYGYPVQPGYPPYGYPVQPGYPAYVYAVQPGVYPAGVMPVQPVPTEQISAQQPVSEQSQPAPAQTESKGEEEIPPHPMPPVSLLPKSKQSAPAEPVPARPVFEERRAEEPKPEEQKPVSEPRPAERKPDPQPAPAQPASAGSSRFNRRTRSTGDSAAASSAAAPASPSAAASDAPAGGTNDWFGVPDASAPKDSSSAPAAGRASRFNRRSK